MKISVIIPAHNEESFIGGCLDHIYQNIGNIHEVIVVDNASTDRTAEIAGRKGAKVVREDRKGTGYARQRGLEEATGDFVAYFDADTQLPSGWITKVEKIFTRYPKLVSLSGPYRYYDANWFQRLIMNAVWYVSAPLPYRIVGYMILGGNFIASRKALLAIGGFDTSIAFFGDDTDTARRLSTQGKVMFRMDLYVYSSARRFQNEGVIKTNIKYALNFLWPVLFHHPFTKARPKS